MWQQLGPGESAGVNLGLCGSSSALVVCSGHSATYVVPVFKVCPGGRTCAGVGRRRCVLPDRLS
jgi:hypothetical protein